MVLSNIMQLKMLPNKGYSTSYQFLIGYGSSIRGLFDKSVDNLHNPKTSQLIFL